MEATPDNKRRYRGMDGPEREAQRRALLLDAGLELFGTLGYDGTTVEAVCQHSGLAKRYFYESFTRESLFTAVYNAQIQSVEETVLAALAQADPAIEAQAQAGVSTVIRAMLADPRVARITLLEIVRANRTMERRGSDVKHEFAEIIITILLGDTGDPRTTRVEMGATALVGVIYELMVDWLVGRQNVDVEEIVAFCIDVFDLFHQQYLRELNKPT